MAVTLRGTALRGQTAVGPAQAPLLQLLALDPVALWWPTKATMTVARDGTGAAPLPGQPVGRMLDLSGNVITATAPGDSNRPLLGRVPVTGRRNLLIRTEEFNDPAWDKQNTAITANATVAPDGTTTADYFSATNVSGFLQMRSPFITLRTNTTYTISIFARAAELTSISMQIWIDNVFVSSATSTSLTSDWVRLSTTFSTTTNTSLQIRILFSGSVITVTGTKGIYIWGAQLETGSTVSDYQKVVTALDVTEAGVADTYYASFDGVDDHFALSESIPITEEMTVVRAFGRSAAGINNSGLGATASNTQYDFQWFTSNDQATWMGNGYSVANAASTAIGSFVSTAQKVGSTQSFRLNGVAPAQTELGSGGNIPFTVLGRRFSDYNNGPISFLAVFDRELTGAELALVESIAAGTNGATLA